MIPGAGSLPLVEAAIIEEREWPTRELPANPASLDSDDCVIPLYVSESPFVLPVFFPFFSLTVHVSLLSLRTVRFNLIRRYETITRSFGTIVRAGMPIGLRAIDP